MAGMGQLRVMYASNAQDAIPTLIDQGDNISFLLTNCNLRYWQKPRARNVADDAAYSAGI